MTELYNSNVHTSFIFVASNTMFIYLNTVLYQYSVAYEKVINREFREPYLLIVNSCALFKNDFHI